jgi:NTE family protein
MVRFVAFLLFAAISFGSLGQSVGLVLSGGGAKGIAHIGVIEALEKNNIPIDYVGGTSMGAIVSALYAIGYTPQEMKDLLGSEDFLSWSTGDIDPEKQFYYKIKEDRPDWMSVSFVKQKGGFKPQLPTNLVSPEQMDLRFMQFLSPSAAGAGYNFDSLMVPFFCVASDVYRKKPVVFRRGELPAAVRSSMTFPGYFKPLMIDSTLLFDGGMENNFPVDIMDSVFKPDIIIGSTVAKNPPRPDPDDLFMQLENIFMKATDYSVPENGVLIAPDVSGFGIMDFQYYDSLRNQGFHAAMEKMDSIKTLIKRRVSPAILNMKRGSFKAKAKPFLIKNIFITGVDQLTANYVLKNILRNRAVLTFEEFEKEYFKLLSDKQVTSLYPKVVFNEESGYFDLYLEVKTKDEIRVSLGGNVASNLRSMGFLGVDYAYQKKNAIAWQANAWLGRFYAAFNGSLRIDFPPRNIAKERKITPFFVRFSGTSQTWDYFKATNDWFVDDITPARFSQQEQYLSIDLGRPSGNRGILSSGYSFGDNSDYYFQSNIIERDDTADRTLFSYSTLHTTYEYSTLNYKQYPTHGLYLLGRAKYVTGQEQYTPGSSGLELQGDDFSQGHSWVQFECELEYYRKVSNRFVMGLEGDLFLSNKDFFSNGLASLISAKGFTPFPQSRVHFLESFKANNFMAFGVMPIFNIWEGLHLRSGIYIFQPYKAIVANSFVPQYSKVLPDPKLMANLALVLQTPVGPIAVSGAYFQQEDQQLYFQVNFGYVLFRPKGIH